MAEEDTWMSHLETDFFFFGPCFSFSPPNLLLDVTGTIKCRKEGHSSLLILSTSYKPRDISVHLFKTL